MSSGSLYPKSNGKKSVMAAQATFNYMQMNWKNPNRAEVITCFANNAKWYSVGGK